LGFRFRKSIKILPGLRVNLSKSGVSTSLGIPGATVNVGRRGVRGTAGIPGTGLSYSERLESVESSGTKSGGTGSVLVLLLILAFIGWALLH
jgi:hypothetical protein